MLLWVLQRELLNAIPRMQKIKYSEGFRVVGGGPTGFQLWLCLGRRSKIALSSGGRDGVSSPLTTAPTRWRRSCFSGSRNRLVAPAGTEHAGAQTQMRGALGAAAVCQVLLISQTCLASPAKEEAGGRWPVHVHAAEVTKKVTLLM